MASKLCYRFPPPIYLIFLIILEWLTSNDLSNCINSSPLIQSGERGVESSRCPCTCSVHAPGKYISGKETSDSDIFVFETGPYVAQTDLRLAMFVTSPVGLQASLSLTCWVIESNA